MTDLPPSESDLSTTAAPQAPVRWIAVNTHPHREHFAIENLERQDFVAYCPLIRKRIRHARRVHDAQRPLFPGYVFVEITNGLDRWRPITSTYGVRSIVMCGERLSFIDAGFVASLMAREVDGVIVRPTKRFCVGQSVRMAGGAFDGLVAEIIEMDERDRLVVLLDLLNRPVRVRLEATGVSEI